jgi:CBS domain-containing protein
VTDLMTTAGVSCVLVGHDTSVVTRRDLADALGAGLDGVLVDEDATVVEAAARTLRGELRHVVVCDVDGQGTGLVGIHHPGADPP